MTPNEPSDHRQSAPVSSSRFLSGRSVLVTGGTGTIGSEIVRQVLGHQPRVLRVFSRDETRQVELREELGDRPCLRFLIGDIRDRARLDTALEGIEVVFHAAALKHVPACEYNPFEAVQTNVVGTQNLLQACRETGVERFVYISTDKAVNPTNTMGATKLLAENLVRATQEFSPSLLLSTVRFGNVLGSRGSLLPVLSQRIDSESRVGVTSTEMTRFMMTIRDAVSLVLESARASSGGETCILRMPALRVIDLVEVFVEEYCSVRGRDPRDVEIVETGIRPGEKLHEELLTLSEYARVIRRDETYVVQPPARLGTRIEVATPSELPDEFHSARAPLLGRDAIRNLIQRSGILETHRQLEEERA
ncbi:MAG: polysaccharide biosynthesis protein [Planctomycetes bacterium]|nr:polysaccharide biosynthesis protein [Planctomycetota bacterium]